MSYTANRLINPSVDLPYQLMDGNGTLGLAKATGTFQFSGSPVLGFKIGSGLRIENCTVTIPNSSYSASFGVSTDWNLVGYFPTSDLNITSQGIGRGGSGGLGNGWTADTCGFYLNINSSTIQNADTIILEYDFFSLGSMKHGVGFFLNTNQPSGLYGGPDGYYVGTWDNSSNVRIYLPSSLSIITYIPRGSFSNNVRYRRKVTIRNKLT
jgi:hypothetical protein